MQAVSGAGPCRLVRATSHSWDLAEERELRRLYEVVLTEGGPGDPEQWLDATILRRVWPDLYLPRHVRQAWERLLTC